MTEYSINKIFEILDKLSNKQSSKAPNTWKVVIHNDDFTPMDFVSILLQNVFGKSIDESNKLVMHIHNNGKANIDIFTKEVALTKVSQVHEISEKFGHPLKATAEQA